MGFFMGIASRPESVACPRQIFKELRLSVDAVEATRSSLVAAVARQRRRQPEKQKARNLAVSGPCLCEQMRVLKSSLCPVVDPHGQFVMALV